MVVAMVKTHRFSQNAMAVLQPMAPLNQAQPTASIHHSVFKNEYRPYAWIDNHNNCEQQNQHVAITREWDNKKNEIRSKRCRRSQWPSHITTKDHLVGEFYASQENEGGHLAGNNNSRNRTSDTWNCLFRNSKRYAKPAQPGRHMHCHHLLSCKSCQQYKYW